MLSHKLNFLPIYFVKAVFYEPNQPVVLATKHAKERAIARPLRVGLGFRVVIPENIDTDVLGTFTGEVERPGSMREVALAKARLGMEETALALGMASEGSFGPHPSSPFFPADYELLVFADDANGFHVFEQILTTETNFAHIEVSSFDGLADFLLRVMFPSHAVIARPNRSAGGKTPIIWKGLQSPEAVRQAIKSCLEVSDDGLVHVETDMRAQFNPKRMRVIRQLAVKLARRLRERCSSCGTPGFGIVDRKPGLPCELCGLPTMLARAEIHACPKCGFQKEFPLPDAPHKADARYCQFCNP